MDLWSGPWRGPSNTKGVPAYVGPAAIALKRIVSRAEPDLFPWQGFDHFYNRRLERALAAIQRKHGLPGTGQTGHATFLLLMRLNRKGHPGELAADATARNLFEDAWAKLHPPVTPLTKVHEAITDYWHGLISYGTIWHYLQRRPFTTLGVKPYRGGRSDCSEATTDAMFYARMVTGVFVPDPNGRGYDGWGNTDTQYAENRARTVHGAYAVGDLGIYGPASKTRHVVQCIKAGDAASSEWGSNGSESGPFAVRLGYRSDLLAVVRPRLLPS